MPTRPAHISSHSPSANTLIKFSVYVIFMLLCLCFYLLLRRMKIRILFSKDFKRSGRVQGPSPSIRHGCEGTIFTALIVNIWNSLPNSVVDANSVNAFKALLDKFWLHQEVMFDFTADLSGTRNRSVLS